MGHKQKKKLEFAGSMAQTSGEAVKLTGKESFVCADGKSDSQILLFIHV